VVFVKERGPELGQMEKQARISMLEIRPFNESFADTTILRPVQSRAQSSKCAARWITSMRR